MEPLSSQLEQSVADLVDELGKALTLRKVTEGTYDPETGEMSAASTSDTSVVGVLYDYADEDIDGTRIQMGDRRCLIKAKSLSVAPESGDRIVDGSTVYTVVRIKKHEAGGVVSGYNMQVRGV